MQENYFCSHCSCHIRNTGLCSWFLVPSVSMSLHILPLFLFYFIFFFLNSYLIEFSIKKVAVDCTRPNGRVLGVDIIPAQPPKGVSTIQGNFLAPEVQNYVQDFLCDPKRGRPYQDEHPDVARESLGSGTGIGGLPETSKISETRQSDLESKPVDVVLSDMSAPWHQTSGFWKRSLSEPYNRMMNTSGVIFRDHAGSMVCISCDIKRFGSSIRADSHFHN